MAKRLGWIELYTDSSASWRWRVVASNGKNVDIPGESFSSKSNAKRAAVRQHPELVDRIRVIEHQFK
jgi:uncharacterized protein YegP (UPF0339 family)